MILLEILIALALVALCMIPLISPHITLIQQQKRFDATMEIDRVVNLLYVDILERMQKNEIPWNKIQDRSSQIPIDDILERLQEKNIPLTGFYQFGEIIHKANKDTGWEVHHLSLTFAITPKGSSNPLVFPFSIPVIRHQTTPEDNPDDNEDGSKEGKKKKKSEKLEKSEKSKTKTKNSSKKKMAEEEEE